MIRLLKWMLSVLAMLAVVACGGGGGDPGTPPFGDGGDDGGSTPTAADVVLVLSASTVANNGSETIVATATAIDANRNTVAGVPVTIRVDNGGVATPSGTVTGDAGTVTASIGIGADRTSRTMNVTAVSGSITKSVQLQVVESVGGGTAPSDLLLTLSSATIANTGTGTVTATVTALDAKRNVLPGVAVTIEVNQGATVAPSGTTTDDAGVVTGAIGIGADRANRTITVTASGGGLVRTSSLQVVDSPTTENPVAADLSLSLSASTLSNGGTSTIVATATAVDANRNALAGIPVTFKVDGSAVAVPNGTATNTAGVVTAAVGIGADRSNRVITVTATSGALTRSASFSVTGATLTSALSPLVNTGSTNNQIEYRLVDTNGSPMTGVAVSVTAAGLPNGSGTTDINGKYVYTYTAPGAPTTLRIVASAAGDEQTDTVTVQSAGGGSIPPATLDPQSVSLTPSPSVIPVNVEGSSSNQVELRALFLGPDNKPIPNMRARFDLAGNANSSDGVVSWLGGNFSYSDATGVARGTFTPGQRSSPTNGVTVRVCYAKDDWDFATTACPSGVTNTLTVTSEALSVNIRTNELIKEGPARLTYIKEFVVMVVDAAGQAKADVLITPSVDLPAYYKGFYFYNGQRWQQSITLLDTERYSWDPSTRSWSKSGTTTQPQCPNEDVNRNGVREAGAYSPGDAAPALAAREEDLNWNGDLDPRKADVAIKMVNSARTDANGLAIVQIEYGKDLATWVDYVITVTASGISGSEARARYSGLLYGVGNLPAPGSAVTDRNAAPAFLVSPYGIAEVCTDPN